MGLRSFAVTVLLGVTGAAAATAPAHAQLTAGQFLEFHEQQRNRILLEPLLNGIGRGIFVYNTMLVMNNPSATLYCQPANLTIESAQYLSILRHYVEQDSISRGREYVEVALLNALQGVFPCARRR